MKRTLLLCLIVYLALLSSDLQAQDDKPIGNDHFTVKVGVIYFFDETFDSGHSGPYFGLEGYAGISPTLYIGGEFGTSGNFTLSGNDITYTPLELNIKYASALTDYLALDFGGGLSYNRTEFDGSSLFSSTNVEIVDWLFGGQIFADLYCVLGWFTFGANLKYQLTQKFEDASWNANNFRGGLQAGIVF